MRDHRIDMLRDGEAPLTEITREVNGHATKHPGVGASCPEGCSACGRQAQACQSEGEPMTPEDQEALAIGRAVMACTYWPDTNTVIAPGVHADVVCDTADHLLAVLVSGMRTKYRTSQTPHSETPCETHCSACGPRRALSHRACTSRQPCEQSWLCPSWCSSARKPRSADECWPRRPLTATPPPARPVDDGSER
jgi:hypothetical protein